MPAGTVTDNATFTISIPLKDSTYCTTADVLEVLERIHNDIADNYPNAVMSRWEGSKVHKIADIGGKLVATWTVVEGERSKCVHGETESHSLGYEPGKPAHHGFSPVMCPGGI